MKSSIFAKKRAEEEQSIKQKKTFFPPAKFILDRDRIQRKKERQATAKGSTRIGHSGSK